MKPILTRFACLTSLAALFLLSVGAHAVGFFFVQESGDVEVTLAGARAFVHRDGSIENLMLQVGFTGTASEFAWVVAVPSTPAVQFGNAAIFEELSGICNPNILQPSAKSMGRDFKSLPNKEEPPPPIQLQSFAIFSPEDSTGFVRWLHEKKVTVPAASYRVIQDYVKRKWYFIAAHVRTSPAKEARWLQPLSITFRSQRAVLPMLFSSLESSPFVVQLYTATTVTTKADGFAEAYTTQTPARTKFKMNEFPLFFAAVTKDCQLTELRGLFDPKGISADIMIVPK